MITIIDTPASGSTAQDDMWHIVTSDNSGQTDFKYVFDVFVGGSQKIRVKKYPEPSNGQGYFDAGAVVRNYFTYEWFTPVDSIYCYEPNSSGEVKLDYDVRYGEDYSGTTTLNMASGTTTAYNWIAPLWKRRKVSITDKLLQFLTNRPLTANASLGTDRLMIPFYSDQELFVFVRTYNRANDLIQTATDYPASGTTLANGFVQMNISPSAINNYFGTTVIDENVKYYTVTVRNSPLANTAIFRVNMVCEGMYTPMPLHFINAWGMFDTARFDLVSRLNMDMERKSFTQRDHTYGNSSIQYYDDNNVYKESKINYLNRSNHRYKLTMDAPTDDEYKWLAELITSPQIYLEYNGDFYPVTIKSDNYEYSTIINNRMKPLEIEVEINQPRYSHRR